MKRQTDDFEACGALEPPLIHDPSFGTALFRAITELAFAKAMARFCLFAPKPQLADRLDI
jgi:hypothetical protein